MTDETNTQDTEQGAVEAPFGYKSDGTPRKRKAPVRRAVPRHNVLEQKSPDRDHRPANVRTTRRSRAPVDGYRRRLPHYDLGPDYVGRWVVDSGHGDRIRDMYAQDWDFVVPKKDGGHEIKSDDLGTNLSIVANRTVGGEKQYLMAKPRQMYEEDRKAKRRRNDAIDEALMAKSSPRDKDGSPLPTAGNPHFYDAGDGRNIHVGSRKRGTAGREF